MTRVLLNFHPRFLLVALLLALAGGGPGRAAEAAVTAAARDVLVYPDGDRVQGRLVERTGGILVFQSDRFGLLRVPADTAKVIPAAKSAGTAPAAAVASVPAAVPVPAGAGGENAASAGETGGFAQLAAWLRAGFKPWTGRFAFSTEVVTDSTERNNLSLDLQLQRKWRTNEVQLKARYDFSQTEGRTTADLVKTDGLLRHDFRKKGFMLYRPVLEWSRASFRSGVPSDYVLLQQELGAGLNLLSKDKYKVRTGVSENLFDVWSLVADPADDHSSRTTESAFVENELKLPWSLLMVQRGVYYYSVSSQDGGWENRVELTKKFTKTLSTALRHEMRRGSPDGRAQDYDRLKLLFGVDF
ncbi:MAG: DUF481 domain-containing protein [Opitutae bacterium]|nr:DUF481 domain-containing protein [Opitutae bacterium]